MGFSPGTAPSCLPPPTYYLLQLGKNCFELFFSQLGRSRFDVFLDWKAVSRDAMSLWMGTRCLFVCPLWQGVTGTVSSPPPALQHRSRIHAGGALLADLTSCCPLSPPALARFILCRWPAGLLSGDVSSHRYLHFYTPFLLCYFFPPRLIF